MTRASLRVTLLYACQPVPHLFVDQSDNTCEGYTLVLMILHTKQTDLSCDEVELGITLHTSRTLTEEKNRMLHNTPHRLGVFKFNRSLDKKTDAESHETCDRNACISFIHSKLWCHSCIANIYYKYVLCQFPF